MKLSQVIPNSDKTKRQREGQNQLMKEQGLISENVGSGKEDSQEQLSLCVIT